MFSNTHNYFQLPENYIPKGLKEPKRPKPAPIKIIGGNRRYRQRGRGDDDSPPMPPPDDPHPDEQINIEGAKIADEVVGSAVSTIGSASVNSAVDLAVNNITDIFKFGRELIRAPDFAGEKHAILQTADGNYKKGNFIGPGTAVNERLKSKDLSKPMSEVDRIAKRHDLDYFKANTTADVRLADNRMLKSVKKAETLGLDTPFNLSQAKLIAFKTKLEDLGINPEKFASFGGFDNMADDDKKRQEESLAELVQQGYGTKWDDADVDRFKRHQTPKPAENLYNKLVKKNKRKKKHKIPKNIRKRIIDTMDIQQQFKDEEIPDNVKLAIQGM